MEKLSKWPIYILINLNYNRSEIIPMNELSVIKYIKVKFFKNILKQKIFIKIKSQFNNVI